MKHSSCQADLVPKVYPFNPIFVPGAPISNFDAHDVAESRATEGRGGGNDVTEKTRALESENNGANEGRMNGG